MLECNMVVVVLKVAKLDIGPASAPGGSDENLDLSSFSDAEKEKMAVKVQHGSWCISIDNCIDSGNGFFQSWDVIVRLAFDETFKLSREFGAKAVRIAA
jgi:hypothetical protein